MQTSILEMKVLRQMQTLTMLAALSLLALACSSNNNSGTPGGTGGSAGGGGAGSGGTSGGTGGTSAGPDGAVAAGGATGTGGAPATDGGNPDGPVACVTASATTPLISDFAGTLPIANQANGGTAESWVVTPGGTATVANGEMHGATTMDPMNKFASASVVLAKGLCVDVSKYTGVKFSIRSPSNTMLVFGVQTPETMVDFSNFNKVFPVTATATVVMVAFADLKATFGAGAALPATYNPGAHLRAIAIGILGATVATQTEPLDIYLSNVTFY